MVSPDGVKTFFNSYKDLVSDEDLSAATAVATEPEPSKSEQNQNPHFTIAFSTPLPGTTEESVLKFENFSSAVAEVVNYERRKAAGIPFVRIDGKILGEYISEIALATFPDASMAKARDLTEIYLFHYYSRDIEFTAQDEQKLATFLGKKIFPESEFHADQYKSLLLGQLEKREIYLLTLALRERGNEMERQASAP